MEVRKHHQLKISNQFVALENLDDSGAINRASNNIRTPKSQLKKVYISMNGSSIKHGLMNNDQSLSIKGSSLHCSDCMIQAVLMQIICILLRCETSRHCKNKQQEFWGGKINEPKTNSMNKNIRGLSRASMNLRSIIRIKLTQ